MAYVITRLCLDCKDMACVEVCPVNCIYEYAGNDPKIPKNQLLIDPDECIDCNACEPSCPWQAIFSDKTLPEIFKEDLEVNARIVGQERIIPEKDPTKPVPSPEEVQANKKKWGF